jgi:hypothetical protein
MLADPMQLVDRCRRALANRGESATARGFREALAAAEAGQGDEAAKALSALGEPERFVATVLIGVAYPGVRRATAIAFDAAVPPAMQALSWSFLCERRLVERWAIACDDVGPEVLGRLLGRAGYASAATMALAAIRARLAAGRTDDAIALLATIDAAAKEERAAARAAIGRKLDNEGELLVAIREAERRPMVQYGFEETQALADILRELMDLPPTHGVVERCIARLKYWGRTRVEKDARSYGVTSAVEVCVQAGWLEHARALVEVVWGKKLRARCERAIASGKIEEAAREPLVEPNLDAITSERTARARIRTATTRALCRLDAGDREGAFASLLLGIDGGGIAKPPADREIVDWARALASSGQRKDALVALRVALEERPSSDLVALAAELGGPETREFANSAFAPELQSKMVASMERLAAATSAARLVACVHDRELEARLIATMAEERFDGGDAKAKRFWRLCAVVGELARGLSSAAERRERLEAWGPLLGPEKHVLAAAPELLVDVPLAELSAAVGTLDADLAPPLAGALARAGRWADALELVTPVMPWRRQEAIVQIAQGCATHADRKKVIAAYKKCPKHSSKREAQGIWKFHFAEIHLLDDDVDAALDVLSKLKLTAYAHFGPGALASAIAAWLDADAARWTPERASVLLDVIGGPNLHPQNTLDPVFVIAPRVIQHVPELAPQLDRVRSKFRHGTDAAAVSAAEALGHAYAGDPAAAAKLLDSALTLAHESGAGWYASAAYFLKCLCAAPMQDRDALWGRAFALVADNEPDKAANDLSQIFSRLGVADVKLAADALGSIQLPREVADQGLELARRVRDREWARFVSPAHRGRERRGHDRASSASGRAAAGTHRPPSGSDRARTIRGFRRLNHPICTGVARGCSAWRLTDAA